MANIFSGAEVVEIGIQIEKNGYDFYNTLAERTKSPKTEEMYRFLAGEEEKHIAVFQQILNTVQKYSPPEAYPGEYFAYMNALAREHIFTQENKGRQAAEQTTSDKQAIDLALGFEKDSIVFYEKMKEVVPQQDLKIIDALIRQEVEHVRILTGLIKNL